MDFKPIKLIPINEIYVAPQGEGATVGKLSIFIRVSGCNLACNFCDSKYTWEILENEYMTIDEIEQEIKRHPKVKNIVITGGEPLLYQEQLNMLIGRLEHTIEIETNGTFFCNLDVDYLNVSPKVHSPSLKEYAKGKNVIWKFVIFDEAHLKEIEKEFIEPLELKDNIYLMPLGGDKSSHIRTLELCKKYGYNFSPRIQVLLFDKERGV